MGRIIVEQITSADGFAAEPHGGIDFMRVGDLTSTDTSQFAMLEGADAMLFGATTYRMFADYWPDAVGEAEPVKTFINDKPKHVFSSSLDSAPWGAHEPAIIERGDPVARSRELEDRYAGDIIVWGSLTLSTALPAAGLVDVVRVRTVPVLLGAGLPWAPAVDGGIRLALDTVSSHPGGHTVVQYTVAHDHGTS